ncbi:unnamed protein product [Lactuca saligna]|uniref:Membrane-associated kinase regulator 2 n=1 Tax=Lactuca saligna TaxID=75948 RepID=A0AA35ZB59_LACSI|nr:unnamed protein product [Lactuca saligna]
MEAFSLLRYWRSNGGDGSANANVTTSAASPTATTIVTAVSTQTSDTGDDEDDENDHGPFFDLEFSLPAEGGDDEDTKDGDTGNGVDYGEEEEDEEDEEESDERELKFTLLSGSSGDSTNDANVSVSPSDELFFNGGFVPVDRTTETNLKPPQLRVSLMKSATKLRVMMLKFKKSNVKWSESSEANASGCSDSKEEKQTTDQTGEDEGSGKSMTVKFKVEEVPIVSLFKRHNSSKAPKKRQNDDVVSEEKKFSKESMQKYLRKVKPLYVRVSKKYGEKLKFSGQLNLPRATKSSMVASPASEEQKQSPKREKESIPEVSEPPLLMSNAKGLKQGNLPAGLRVVCKHLGKSRSASTAVVAAAPPGTISSKRRDDSLLQQQDGIQSAILHCKRSFKASRDSGSDCSSSLSRSGSDPAAAYVKSANSSSSDAAECKETEEINDNKSK